MSNANNGMHPLFADVLRIAADETDARSQLARQADAKAAVVLADAAMPDDMRQMAARLGVEHLMRTVWLSAYLAGWRAGTAREWPAAIDGAEVMEPEQ